MREDELVESARLLPEEPVRRDTDGLVEEEEVGESDRRPPAALLDRLGIEDVEPLGPAEVEPAVRCLEGSPLHLAEEAARLKAVVLVVAGDGAGPRVVAVEAAAGGDPEP